MNSDVAIARAEHKILEMFHAEAGEMFRESLLQGFRQGNDAVPAAFAIMDGDGALAEIEISGDGRWSDGLRGLAEFGDRSG